MDQGKFATQVCTVNKVCSAVTKFDIIASAVVDGKEIEPINNGIYVSNRVLKLLGNPGRIIVTVSAAT